jgi:hypothetical protein
MLVDDVFGHKGTKKKAKYKKIMKNKEDSP